MPSQRFTVWPFASCSMKVSSRVFFTFCAISLDVHHLRDRILRLIAERVNNYAAAHRTVGTGAAGLAGARDFQVLSLGVDRSEIESQYGEACSAKDAALEKGPAGEFH